MAARAGGARLKDVARSASVSVATVSRFLNGSLTLPSATVQRIERAVQMLDYRPNPHARRLSLGRADAIGLVLPDIANPFFAGLAAAVERAADAAGLELLLSATLNRAERELAYLERMRRQHMDGLIFVTNHGDPSPPGALGPGPLARAINAARGVVLVDEDVPGTAGGKVFADNEQGGELAGRHLLRTGHRDFAFLGGPADLMSGQERLAGFRRAIAAEPGARLLATLSGPYGMAHGRAAAAALLAMQPRPTAIFAASDEIALGALAVLKESGVEVPQAMSLIAFDDVGPLELIDPPLTAIRQPLEAIGRQAVEMLGAAAPATIRLPVTLTIRGSVVPPQTVRSATRRRI
ncbi:MAG TPA: LacI family DNA-binding transcriptional regulator [Acetobacteraceae bacterium]|nr:LacI family DNA-binding transcriptional regulator [Acetobacteraceae bacterium]